MRFLALLCAVLVSLSTVAATANDTLVIHEAVYGDLPDGPKDDVLGTVKLYLKNNRLEVDVENYLLGDPASGVFKRLRVEYMIGDVKLAKSTYEGGTLTIEVLGEAKADAAK